VAYKDDLSSVEGCIEGGDFPRVLTVVFRKTEEEQNTDAKQKAGNWDQYECQSCGRCEGWLSVGQFGEVVALEP
jgi:hypothetical protein